MQSMNDSKRQGRWERAAGRSSFVTTDEAHLLACARAGDAAAFESLAEPHRNAMLRVAQRVLRNREDAEDAVQTAFLDALRNLHGFEGRSRFSSWLMRIAMNAAFMRLRVSRRENEVSLDEMMDDADKPAKFYLSESRPNPEQEVSAKEAQVLLNRALRRLGPIYVEVIRMRNVQQLSAREAAHILRLPVGTVKARLHRARTRLVRSAQLMLIPRQKSATVTIRSAEAIGSRDAIGA